MPGKQGIFTLANKLIEFFVRQRLAELGRALSLEESINFLIPSLNSKAYLQILSIETQLRNFIGDVLLSEFGKEWIEKGLDLKSEDGRSLKNKVCELFEQEENSIYTVPGIKEPLLRIFGFWGLE